MKPPKLTKDLSEYRVVDRDGRWLVTYHFFTSCQTSEWDAFARASSFTEGYAAAALRAAHEIDAANKRAEDAEHKLTELQEEYRELENDFRELHRELEAAL